MVPAVCWVAVVGSDMIDLVKVEGS